MLYIGIQGGQIEMDIKKLSIVPLICFALATIYISVFNRENYFEFAFIWYFSTIIIRNKILIFYEKNAFILFIVSEFLLLVYTINIVVSFVLADQYDYKWVFAINSIFFVIEILYSHKEYPFKNMAF